MRKFLTILVCLAATSTYAQTWEWRAAAGNQHWLYRDGVLDGAWHHDIKAYTVHRGGKWVTKEEYSPPIVPPSSAGSTSGAGVGSVAAADDFGVSVWALSDKELFTYQGRPMSRSEFTARVGGHGDEGIRDDSKLPSLLILADDRDARKRVVAELMADPEWPTVAHRIKAPWAVAKDHPLIKDSGFVLKDGVYLQMPSGEVMYRQEGLVTTGLVGALRKKIDGYDPLRDAKSGAWSESDTRTAAFLAVGAVVVVGLARAVRRPA